MNEAISRCGFCCDKCPAFAGNNQTFADQLRTATGWSRYLGLQMSPDKIRCNGCLSSEPVAGGEEVAENDLPDRNCPIRPCVLGRGMNTCADCFDYPCNLLQTRMNGVDDAILRLKGKVPQAEYDAFIAPYDYRKTLDSIRDRRIDRID